VDAARSGPLPPFPTARLRTESLAGGGHGDVLAAAGPVGGATTLSRCAAAGIGSGCIYPVVPGRV
jgi:hypothetical protein